ncbi:hypothetical protein [Portibacter marinus]|uniref:hypothetical protein n=1 Tax=Portibacter marinus TaxID=2898660 RepID=UPI001F487E1C|nr:hypothetical protein [Portibacter marinus]
MKNPYQPVDCNFIDQVEIMATRKLMVNIAFLHDDQIKTIYAQIKTWFTKEKVEYLETQDGMVFRMDEIIEINGVTNIQSCTF